MTEKTQNNSKYKYYQITPFRDNELGVDHWDSVLKNISVLWEKNIQFTISGNQKVLKFFVKLPVEFEVFFQNTFFANFPTSNLELANEDDVNKIEKSEKKQNFISYKNNKNIHWLDFFKSTWTYMDPMKDLLSLFANIPENDNLSIFFDMQFKKGKSIWKSIVKILKAIWGTTEKEKEEMEIHSEDIFMNIGYSIKTQDGFIIEWIKKNFNSVLSIFGGKCSIKSSAKRIPLSFSQAVNFFHIPTKDVFVKGLEYNVYKKLPYPTNLPTPANSNKDELTLLGKTNYRSERVEFGIKKEDKFRHMYVVGKTGTWKSTFLSNMIRSDIQAGNWLCLLDPHGDLVDTVLEHIPKNRINDVVLFDVADTDFPIGFNLLQADNDDEKNRIVSWVVSTFYKLFEHSRGPRLEYILRNVVLTVIEYPNATLMHILRVLVDKDFRAELCEHVTDPVVKRFWEHEFNKWNDRQREEAIWPITNKIWQFLSSKVVRNIFWQPNTKLNVRQAMDEGKIILVNLSKGKIGEDNATMIGSLLVTKIQIDAMSRADIPMEQRKDFYLYIDEFQNFATKAFATILSEARKYKLSLIVANQFTEQLDEDIRAAIFGNVGSIMAFTLGKDDAEIISGQFKGIVSTNDLISLPMFNAYLKLMVDGINSDAFSMMTLPLPSPDGSLELIDKIRTQSRQRYAMEKNRLEKLMDTWNKKTFTIHDKVKEKAKLQWLGISDSEIANMNDFFVQSNIWIFDKTKFDGVEPDGVVFDTVHNKHKIVWYKKPWSLNWDYNHILKKGQKIKTHDWSIFDVHVDVWHSHADWKYQIWIWEKDEILAQVKEVYSNTPKMKFCPNVEKLENQAEHKSNNQNSGNEQNLFDISNIKIWEKYGWLVKLKYNYGMFITVKWVEGLLHKNEIKTVEWTSWKKLYNIWDKIEVIAQEIKEINWEKKVVWGQG